MNLGRRIGRNALAKVVGEVANRGGGFLLFFLLARWLGPGTFGRYSFALSYATLFAVLVDLGTNVIVTREIARRPDTLPQLAPRLNGFKIASTALFLAVLAASLPLSARAREAAGLILAMGTFVAATLLLESLCALLSGMERMGTEALAKALTRMGLLAGATAGFWSSHSLAGTVTGLLVGMAAGLAMAYALLMRQGAPAAIRWDGAWNRALLAQSLPLGVSWVFWNVYDNQDVVLLAYLGLPLATVGHFAASMKVIDALRGLPVLITGSVFPLLSTGAVLDRSQFGRLASLLLRALLFVAVPIAVGGWMLAPAVIRWIYGPGFEPAADALRVAAWAVSGICLNHALIHLLVALDLQRLTIAGAAGAAAVNLVGLLLLTPRFGLGGAAGALVISEGAFLGINLALLRGHTSGFWTKLATDALKPLAAGALMAASLHWAFEKWNPLLAGATATVLYFAALMAFGGASILRPERGGR
jgi:O-antigen/teichoic acid export membrane protein